MATPPPTPPPPQPSNLVALWGIVVDPSGECIEGATVEVVAGPVLVGQKATQRLPCDLTRSTGGFEFDEGVPMGGEMTLRASAPGYASQVRTVGDRLVGSTQAHAGPHGPLTTQSLQPFRAERGWP